MKHPLDVWRAEAWTPMRELSSLQRGIDRLFQDFFSDVGSPEREGRLEYSPSCDIDETDTHYVLSFDLPGISKDDVKIDVADNQLRIYGERKGERKDIKKTRRAVERYYGSFSRVFTLPAGVDPGKIEATYQNGVLMVALPKTEVSKAHQVQIGEMKEGSVFQKLLTSETEKKRAA